MASLVRRASIDEEDKQQEGDCKAYPRDRIPDIVADKRCEQSNSAQDADDKRRGKYLTQGLMRTFHGYRHDAAAEASMAAGRAIARSTLTPDFRRRIQR